MTLMIENLEGKDDAWTAEQFHRVHPDHGRECNAWKVIPGIGVQVLGESDVRRSPGAPGTLSAVVNKYAKYADGFFDPALLMSVIANESRGKESCERFEARIGDWSFGLGQLLTGTAWDLLINAKLVPPDKPIPKGGKPEVWSKFLNQASNNLPLVKSFLNGLNRRFVLKNDPILIYAAYNAGSPRYGQTSEWGLVHYGPALDHIAQWYGDANFVLLNGKDIA